MIGGLAPINTLPTLEPLGDGIDSSNSIWIIGDIHEGRDALQTANRNQVTATVKQMAPAAGVFCVGDLTDSGKTAQDTSGIAWATAIGLTRIVGGNHDWRTPRTIDQAMTAWGINPGNAKNWTMDLGFVQVIGVSPDGDTAADNTTIVLSSATLTYLQAQLNAATKDCWIIAHAPLDEPGTVPIPTTGQWSSQDQASIRSMLATSTYAKAWIAGHSHVNPYQCGIGTFAHSYDVGGGKVIANINASAVVQNGSLDTSRTPLYAFLVTRGRTGTVDVRIRDCKGRYWLMWPGSTYVNSITVTAAGSPIAANISLPAITGVMQQAAVLTGADGAWIGTPTPTLARKWQNSPDGTTWTDIASATGTTYTLQSTDVGKRVRLFVTGTNTVGTNTAASIATSQIPSTGTTGSVFARDTFDGGAGTELSAHTMTIGGPWKQNPSVTGQFTVDVVGEVYGPTSGGGFYYAQSVPLTADYDVQLDLLLITDNNNGRLGPVGRMSATQVTGYHFYWDTIADQYKLDALVNNVRTNLAAGVGPGAPATAGSGSTTTSMVRMRGTAISGLINGSVVLGPITDATITAAGFAGMDAFGIGDVNVGLHGENFVATNA